ncbi:hypothetical protein BGZ68_003749 [Mortierella alpina]|nr:hypothetical protein BGZ68_003749 [Mortierella alpina]
MNPRDSNRDEYPPYEKRRRYETEAGAPTRAIEGSRSENIVVLDSDGEQQEYSGSRSKHKGTRRRSRSRLRDRSTARYRSRSRERHRGSRYHSKVRDRDRDRGRKRDRSRRRRRDYDFGDSDSDSDSDDGHYRTRDYDRDILFTSEEDLDATDEDKQDQIMDRRKNIRARSRSQGRVQSRQIISMGPPLTHPLPHTNRKTLKRMQEEQEAFAQQIVERDGIAIWRAWCLDQKFEDGDWITPDKLTAYVDCEITSRERSLIPTQSVVGSFVRPVLRLWGDQTAGNFSGGSSHSGVSRLQEFSEQMRALAKSSSIDLSAPSSSPSAASDSITGLDRMELVISDLKRAQQEAKAKGLTGMLVDPLLVGLLKDQIHFIQALVAPASPASSGSRPAIPAIAASPSHHHMSPSPVTARTIARPIARPTARSNSHPSQKNKPARFQADKIEVPRWYGKERISKLKPGRVYPMNPNVKTVQDVLVEWLEGFDGAPSIQELNNKYRAQWRGTDPSEQKLLLARSCIVREFKRLVLEEGKTEKEALEQMERDASGIKLRTYADKIRMMSTERKQSQELADASRGSAALSTVAAGPPRGGKKNYELDESDESDGGSLSESSGAEESDKSFKESSIADSTSGKVARRNTAKATPRNAPHSTTTTKSESQVFPFPVNDLEKVSDIWQEWHKGWNGGPSLKQLIEQHGRAFYRNPFTRYRHMFYAKQKIVRMLDELIADGILTEQDAIDKMEYYRDGRRPQTLAAALDNIDWTEPLPPDYRPHPTLQQQIDTKEETQQQQQPQQQQPQQKHETTETQQQGFQQHLKDDSHHDGLSFHGFDDKHVIHPAITDMARTEIRSEIDPSAEGTALDVASVSTRSFEQLDTFSDTIRSFEQDSHMSPSTSDPRTTIKPDL